MFTVVVVATSECPEAPVYISWNKRRHPERHLVRQKNLLAYLATGSSNVLADLAIGYPNMITDHATRSPDMLADLATGCPTMCDSPTGITQRQ